MSKESYELLLPTVTALSGKEIKTPQIAIDRFCLDAAHVYNLTKAEKERFCAINFSWELAQILPGAIEGLRYAESLCVFAFESQEEKNRWEVAFENAVKLREHLKANFKLAFRHHPKLLEILSGILEGSSYADFFQDLCEFSLLGKTNAELLKAINFDLSILDEAEMLPRTLSELYAELTVARDGTDKFDIRNRFYTLVKKSTDEIEYFAETIFSGDKERIDEFKIRPRVKKM